jgi:hypothetical protein
MSEAVAERFDAHIAVTAHRLRSAASGARMPKKNDGADAALTMHIAEGCILVTGETQLIKLVDGSKTYQAPWVRRIDDLDDLPRGRETRPMSSRGRAPESLCEALRGGAADRVGLAAGRGVLWMRST